MTAPRLGGPFKYRPAVATDIRKTFARIRRAQAEQAAQPPAPPPPAPTWSEPGFIVPFGRRGVGQ
jgi:hypothetical protein